MCDECSSVLGHGHKLTCSKHLSYRSPLLDGKTGGPVLATDVDGKPAKVKVTKKKKAEDEPAKPKGIKRIPPAGLIDIKLLGELQRGIDTKVIFGIKQPLTTSTLCEYEWFDRESDQSVGCSHAAAFDFEELDTCDTCQHTKKKKSSILCLVHMAQHVVGALESRQTDLFDGDA